MDLFIFGIALKTFGEILLGVAVIRVHSRITREHKIDRSVLSIMRKEQSLSILAILLILAGFTFKVIHYTGTGGL